MPNQKDAKAVKKLENTDVVVSSLLDFSLKTSSFRESVTSSSLEMAFFCFGVEVRFFNVD